MHGTIQKFNPVVKKIWLQTLAGIMWTAVGILLSSYALIWLKLADSRFRGAIFTAGLILAAGVYYWGFSKLAKNNIHRIEAYINEKVCLFAFQKWSSYPLVLFMISLGILFTKILSISQTVIGSDLSGDWRRSFSLKSPLSQSRIQMGKRSNFPFKQD